MGKGSRNRETRVTDQSVNNGTVKLSKKQLIRLQEKKKRTNKIIKWSIAALVAVVIVAAIIITSLPHVPNLEKQLVAENEHFKVDGAMFAYVVYDYVNQYGSYLSSYGYNMALGLLNQTTTYKSGSTSQTWYAYFCGLAESRLAETVSLASKAKEEGMTLSDEDIKEIDESMNELKQYALKSGYGGINKFLNAAYTPGVTAGAVRRVMEMETLAYNYYDKYIDSLEYNDEQFDKYREDNPGSFLKLDYVSYTFTETYVKDATAEQKAEAYAKAKAAAQAFKDTYTTVEAFKNAIIELEQAKEAEKNTSGTTSGTASGSGDSQTSEIESHKSDALTDAEKEKILSNYISEGKLYDKTKAEAEATKDYYEWAYSEDRAVNDMYMLENKASNGDLSYTVYIIEKPVYIDDYASKDVMHILFSVDTSLTGSAADKAFAKAKEEADKILAEYNNGDKTADAFKALAKEHTDDSNGEDGGLYKNVTKGQMVEEFENWIYDETREAGNVDLVKTKYGWHMMYFVGDGMTAWKVTAENGLKSDDYSEHLEELEEQFELEYDYEAMFVSLGGEM